MLVSSIVNLRRFAAEYVGNEPARSGNAGIWRVPLMTAAPIDQRFDILPKIVEGHLHPLELLPTAKSVVVFFIPFKQEIGRQNRVGDRPSRSWAVAYVRTNELINRLTQELSRLLEGQGFRCGATPATHNFTPERLLANWSHRHLGQLTHLGRFGVNRMLITPAGCVGRLGSLVTEAELGEHPLVETAEACLLKAGKPCSRCIDACPVGAISANDFERRRCWERLTDNRNTLAEFADLPVRTHVCGKCTIMLPCSFGNPVAG